MIPIDLYQIDLGVFTSNTLFLNQKFYRYFQNKYLEYYFTEWDSRLSVHMTISSFKSVPNLLHLAKSVWNQCNQNEGGIQELNWNLSHPSESEWSQNMWRLDT